MLTVGKGEQAEMLDMGSELSQQVYKAPHYSSSVMVWCALSGNKVIIGHYFFKNENVTGQTYERISQYCVFPQPRNYAEDIIFYQIGAPLDYVVAVWQYLDQNLPDGWIAKGRLIPWTPRSLYLISCDYFLSKFLKYFVFREPATTVEELKTKFGKGIQNIHENTLSDIYENMENCLCFLLREGCFYFEHLLI